jgi:molybdopterin-containing oxidoreductase family iron-sulfur binding subunit
MSGGKEHVEIPYQTKFGMVINLDKCTGCGACMVACMAENNVPVRYDESDKLRSITWMRVYKLTNGKPFPETDVCWLPRPCMHCEGNPAHGFSPCVSVCPAVATDYSRQTGIVSQIYTRCFGCRYCMGACPYKARYFNWWDPKWPDGMKQYLSPDVSCRMRGIVEKCSFCFHRYQRAMDKSFYQASQGGREDTRLLEEEYQTACAQACPAGAITFGDLLNPEHTVYKLIHATYKDKAFRILEKTLGTRPKVYYVSSKDWVEAAADNHTKKVAKAAPGGH